MELLGAVLQHSASNRAGMLQLNGAQLSVPATEFLLPVLACPGLSWILNGLKASCICAQEECCCGVIMLQLACGVAH